MEGGLRIESTAKTNMEPDVYVYPVVNRFFTVSIELVILQDGVGNISVNQLLMVQVYVESASLP
jgi:hypothetical protein